MTQTGLRSNARKPSIALHERAAFAALQKHRQSGLSHITQLRSDHVRSDRLRFNVAGIHADLTRNQIDDASLDALIALAQECDVQQAIADMFDGAPVNSTENRPAMHVALRARTEDAFGGLGVISTAQRKQMLAMAARLKEKNYTDVIHLGTGGSLLGPRLVAEALPCDGLHSEKLKLHFVGNTDPASIDELVQTLNPKTTLLLVASKSFTTAETMLNASIFRTWLGDAWAQQTVGITALPDKAVAWGLPSEQILTFADWVGGRYSLWSSVSLVAALHIGGDAFEALLAGAAAMDDHFLNAPMAENLPVMMALVGLWYRNIIGIGTRAVVGYADRLALLPDWMQQLEMESNGKSVMHDGQPTGCLTAPVVMGGVGSDVQHSFMQQFHQGTVVVPVDFVAFANADSAYPEHARTLLANCIGQANALAQGRQTDNPHRDLPGNRPSNVMLMPQLDAWHLGAMLALYEHRTYVQSVLWGINAFDQWGVEFGKQLAGELDEALSGGLAVMELL